MSLRNCIPDFEHDIVRFEAGRKILDNYIKPLLSASKEYRKVSSFFNPAIIKSILVELQTCFKNKGVVKLIIGVHDAQNLIPILDILQTEDVDTKFKEAVKKIIEENLLEAIDLMDNPREFYGVIAELVRQDLIQIKIAAVRKDFTQYKLTGIWPTDGATFHPKVSLFKDDEYCVSMNGSINSTLRGLGDNVEEVSFSGSWFAPEKIVAYTEIFEEVWTNTHQDSYTLDFNEEIRGIANQISTSVAFSKPVEPVASRNSANIWSSFLSQSPSYYHLIFPKVRLLPHQIEIYRSLLSRWPIDGLIADEVGLGKTIEAGAIMSYARRFLKVETIALLVPASLRAQWQYEMRVLFDLTFYIYEPDRSRLVLYIDDQIVEEINNVQPGDFFTHGVTRIIFSWHYLRQLSSDGEFRLSPADKIDMIIVDEAHGARVWQDLKGQNDSTRLYQFLREIGPSVTHKILLSATPFQTSVYDYLSLLNILMNADLPEVDSMERVALLNSSYRLQNQQKMDAVIEMINNPAYDSITADDTKPDEDDPVSLLEFYDEKKYLKVHPTSVYTLRNTRDRLKQIGYIFPETILNSTPINLSTKEQRLLQLVNQYVDKYLFSFETALGIKGLGLVKTVYSQRIVSSFKACYDTLTMRFDKLTEYLANRTTSIDIDLIEENEEGEETHLTGEIQTVTAAQFSIAETETYFISEILVLMQNKVFTNNEIIDPKIQECVRLVIYHLEKGDCIILFSRFTSTTQFLVSQFSQLRRFPFGRFEGSTSK